MKEPIRRTRPIRMGYRNLKWKVEGKETTWFVKVYDPVRYPREKLEQVRVALSIQARLAAEGIACPELLGWDGDYLLQAGDAFFCVMAFVPGERVKPGEATDGQMRALGKALGDLHLHLRRLPIGTTVWKPDFPKWMKKNEKQLSLAHRERRPAHVVDSIMKQREMLANMDDALFAEASIGWAHDDLYLDNVLFRGNEVAAILDFDRMRVAYQEWDVARALLSGAFSEKEGDVDDRKAASFMSGYRERIDWSPHDAERALRLLWAKESAWWMTADIEDRSENPRRFNQEIMWIQTHWERLADRVQMWWS